MNGRAFATLGGDYDEFVRQASSPLLRTAVLLVGDRAHAEDLVQLALIRTAGRWSRARQAPHAYARRVLLNLAKDTWRNRARRPEAPTADGTLPDRVTNASDDDVVDRDALLSALAQLPWQQRAVLVLRFLEDLPVADVADVLHCPAGTVRSQTHRGVARLRVLLDTATPSARGAEETHV